jgi:hypothetical protein
LHGESNILTDNYTTTRTETHKLAHLPGTFERPKPIERGDFDDGTAHIALQTSKEDFDNAVEN